MKEFIIKSLEECLVKITPEKILIKEGKIKYFGKGFLWVEGKSTVCIRYDDKEIEVVVLKENFSGYAHLSISKNKLKIVECDSYIEKGWKTSTMYLNEAPLPYCFREL